MGNCSLRAVSDAAQGPDSVHVTGAESKGSLGPNIEDGGKERQEEAVRVSNGLGTMRGKRTPEKGVWKVKLVIDPKDLEQILSEQVKAEALIEQMRMAANSTPKRGKSSCAGFH